MKNIHVLPTDKPSMLIKQGKNLNELFLYTRPIDFRDNELYPQHLYITSNEEINEGEICITFGSNKCNGQLDTFQGSIRYSRKPRKIILTTDQDLIADGVQAIDDEFLQWFVKNPSCESVEVKEKQHFEADKSKRINPLNGVYYSYKIIIPQEEPKKESLEEAAENSWINYEHVEGHLYSTSYRNGFEAGAKWQAERMYSEEEVNEIIAETWLSVEDNEGDETFSQARERILEEFKKTKDGI